MSRPDPTPRPAEEVHFPALHLSPLRLFAVVVVFLVLASYAVWNSERFQNLIQGVSQTRISAALGRPVTFRQVEFRFLPPSVKLADVRIGNDPRLGPEPFLSADEVSIGGGVSLTGQELRLGRIRAVHPKVSLVQFPDGSWNLPSGINRPARKGGLKLRVGEVVIQQGVFDLDGRKAQIDVALEDFAGTLAAIGEDHYSGALTSRKMTLDLADAEPIVSDLSTRFHMEPGHGIVFETIALAGSFGKLTATGAIETGPAARTTVVASGRVSVAEIERIFHSRLGFSGDAAVDARLDVPSGGDFRLQPSQRKSVCETRRAVAFSILQRLPVRRQASAPMHRRESSASRASWRSLVSSRSLSKENRSRSSASSRTFACRARASPERRT